ncbi:MAG: hypothetical protein ACK4UQ_06655 [Brevundimonas sp.]
MAEDKEAANVARELADRLRSIVSQHPMFESWQQAEALARKLEGAEPETPRVRQTEYLRRGPGVWLTRDGEGHVGGAVYMKKRLTQADAAYEVLTEVQHPLPTPDIIARIQQKGAHVGGADPNVNVSSSLSKDPRFQSVRIGSASFWWLAGRSLPSNSDDMLAELLGESGSGAQDSQS